MGLFGSIFGGSPIPPGARPEVDRMLEDLVNIGKREDFLSERSGGPFNAQCRNIRAREIGARLNELGGFELMEWAYKRVRKRLGKELAIHLSYAWAEIGKWAA